MIKAINNIGSLFEQILSLYQSVEWTAYTENPGQLKLALENSSYVYGYFQDSKLIGLIRGLSDRTSINYIQDILVIPSNHNQGIGAELVSYIFELYKDVRTHILLTDDDPGQLAFYKKLKMQNSKEYKEYPLNVFVKFRN